MPRHLLHDVREVTLSTCSWGAIMGHQQHSKSLTSSASAVLPSAEIIPLRNGNHLRVRSNAFTKARIPAMKCPPGEAEKFFWDSGGRGFGMRALLSGHRSWLFQYRHQ